LSQLSVVHTWPSSQTFALPGAQAFAEHASPSVQASPSEQLNEFAA
jgi:hypothetical protein